VVGFAMMSGRILPELDPAIAPRAALRSLSAFVAHGRFDDKLPVAWADRSREQLSALGVQHRIEIYPIGHELNRAVVGSFSRWLDDTLALNASASELD
jgi:phospholipase/carboxylesterase